jgi:hypothetical protein
VIRFSGGFLELCRYDHLSLRDREHPDTNGKGHAQNTFSKSSNKLTWPWVLSITSEVR